MSRRQGAKNKVWKVREEKWRNSTEKTMSQGKKVWSEEQDNSWCFCLSSMVWSVQSATTCKFKPEEQLRGQPYINTSAHIHQLPRSCWTALHWGEGTRELVLLQNSSFQKRVLSSLWKWSKQEDAAPTIVAWKKIYLLSGLLRFTFTFRKV